MSRPFDPKRILRKISNRLLREFFDRKGGLPDVAWDDLSETHAEPIFAAWQGLPHEQRDHAHVILHDVHGLATDCGVRVLYEELKRTAPQLVVQFQGLKCQADQAMWTHLNAPAVFEVARYFARADALMGGRSWRRRMGLPCQQVEAKDGEQCLRQALSDEYWKTEMRGKHCSVERHGRADGRSYYVAYLEDYADTELVFSSEGEPERHEQRRVFDTCFVHNPVDGSLESLAPGGHQAHDKLHRIFGRTVLGLDLGPADPCRPAYVLDHLLTPGRPLPTEPSDHILSVVITRVRLIPADRPSEYVEIGVSSAQGSGRIDMAIDEYLNRMRLTPERVRVKQMAFKVTFAEGAAARAMSFCVTCPSSCDLRNRPERLQFVGERCLKLWKVTQ